MTLEKILEKIKEAKAKVKQARGEHEKLLAFGEKLFSYGRPRRAEEPGVRSYDRDRACSVGNIDRRMNEYSDACNEYLDAE